MAFLNRLVGALPPGALSSISALQFRYPWTRSTIQRIASLMRGSDGVMQQGLGKGLRFNTTANLGYLLGTSEPDVQVALSQMLSRGDVFYDIGANVGFMSMLAARIVGPAGRVVCFEPLPENTRQIIHNASINGFAHVSVKQIALSNQTGNASFVVSSTSTLGRLATPSDPMPVGVERFTEVPVDRLDNFASREQLPAPRLIKIDVEGAEADVLSGADLLLREKRPLLLIELHGTNAAVDDILRRHSYRSFVLGSGAPIVDSHWNSHIVGVPEEGDILNRV